MRYMLDTNTCIDLMRRQPPEVAQRFAQLGFGDVVMSVVTLAELRCGVSARADDQSRVAHTIDRLLSFVPYLPFEATAAEHDASLYKALPGRRRDALDRLIAAHAIAANGVLVSNNAADFCDYPGLRVENWVGAAAA